MRKSLLLPLALLAIPMVINAYEIPRKYCASINPERILVNGEDAEHSNIGIVMPTIIQFFDERYYVETVTVSNDHNLVRVNTESGQKFAFTETSKGSRVLKAVIDGDTFLVIY